MRHGLDFKLTMEERSGALTCSCTAVAADMKYARFWKGRFERERFVGLYLDIGAASPFLKWQR